MRFLSGVTDQYIYFVAVDATDLKTRETGLSGFTVYRSRDGGAAAAYTTPTINETDTTNMPGVYELLLDEDMTIAAGNDSEEVCLHITHASMAPVTRTFELYRPKITAGETLTVASGNGNAAVQSIAANAITAASIATDAIDADAIAAGAIDAAAIANGAIDAATFAAGAIDAAALAADAGTEIATAVWASGTRTLTASLDPTAAAIADAVWDEDIFTGHAVADSAAVVLQGVSDDASTAAANTNTFIASRSEPGQGAPPVGASTMEKIDYLYKAWRNRKTVAGGVWSLFGDDGTTVDQKTTVSDDGTTATVGEIVTGP